MGIKNEGPRRCSPVHPDTYGALHTGLAWEENSGSGKWSRQISIIREQHQKKRKPDERDKGNSHINLHPLCVSH